MSGQNFLTEGKFDTIEQMILDANIQIKAVDFHPQEDLMLVILNTGMALHCPLSAFQRLKNASVDQLKAFRLVGKGRGIHWPTNDETLA